MTPTLANEDDGGLSATDLLRLADRYYELGLLAAARGLLSRLVDVAADDGQGVSVAALRRLAALDLGVMDFPAATLSCEAALDRVDVSDARRPGLERLAAEVALAAGDVVGPERRLRGLVDDLSPAGRVSAQILSAEVALQGDDEASATRLIGELLGDLDSLGEHALETLAALATRTGGAARWRSRLHDVESPRACFVEALILEGEANVDALAVEVLLGKAASALVGARVALASRRARRRGRDPRAREAAVAALEGVLAEPSSLSRGDRIPC